MNKYKKLKINSVLNEIASSNVSKHITY